MKICQVGSFSNSSNEGKREIKAIGGISGYIGDLVSYLLEVNHNIIFIGKIYFFKPQQNLVYKEIQKNPTSTNMFLLTLFLKSFFIRLSGDTIIHAHRPDHFIAFSWFRRNLSVVTLHGQQSRTVFSRKGIIIRWIYGALEYFALKKVTVVLATDKITEQYYLSIYPWLKDKIKVIPTGIDTTKFTVMDKGSCRDLLEIEHDTKVIMYIGRIEPPKRVNDIVLSFQLVHEVFPKTKLVIIGDGILYGEITSLIRELHLSDSVILMGVIMREKLPIWINAADATVLYSYNEGSPLSVKESLACGVPVIANRVGDISDVIVNGVNGYIIEQEDNRSISELMMSCLYNRPIKREACVQSIQKYILGTVYKNIELVYENL